MSSPSLRAPKARRRQRSVRLTVAVGLLVLAALLVGGAVLSGSWLTLVLAAAVGVLLGAAATRITHSELMETRRDAARDRAEQAQAYRELTVARTAEQAEFTRTMESRIAAHESAISELEVALTSAQKRAAEATRKMNAEARRADVAEREGREKSEQLQDAEQRAAEAIVRVAELEQEIDVLRSELLAWQNAPQRRHA
jgi:chromosome segregation ATPase